MLEGFQAGLSRAIILRKREAFREVFAGFDSRKVAAFDVNDIERLMANPGIVRASAKIAGTIHGAQIFLGMQAKGEDFADSGIRLPSSAVHEPAGSAVPESAHRFLGSIKKNENHTPATSATKSTFSPSTTLRDAADRCKREGALLPLQMSSKYYRQPKSYLKPRSGS